MAYAFNNITNRLEDENGNEVIPTSNVVLPEVKVTSEQLPEGANLFGGQPKQTVTTGLPTQANVVPQSTVSKPVNTNPAANSPMLSTDTRVSDAAQKDWMHSNGYGIPQLGNLQKSGAATNTSQPENDFGYNSLLTDMLKPQPDNRTVPIVPTRTQVPAYVAPGHNPMVDWLSMTGNALRNLNPKDPFYRLVAGIGNEAEKNQTQKDTGSLKEYLAKKADAETEYKDSLKRFTTEFDIYKNQGDASEKDRTNRFNTIKMLAEHMDKAKDRAARASIEASREAHSTALHSIAQKNSKADPIEVEQVKDAINKAHNLALHFTPDPKDPSKGTFNPIGLDKEYEGLDDATLLKEMRDKQSIFMKYERDHNGGGTDIKSALAGL